MISAQIPSNEVERLDKLKKYRVLDTVSEQVFDDVTSLAASIMDVPICLVSLVDESRQWFKSKFGLKADETPRSVAFCAHAILSDDLFIVEDSRKDQRFHDNPLVTEAPNVIFYAGAPIVSPDGLRMGTLCLIDNKPRVMDEDHQKILKKLARQVSEILELRLSHRILEEQKNLIENIIDNTDAVVFAKEIQTGKYILANQHCEKMFNIFKEDLIGKRNADVLPSEIASKFEEIDDQVISEAQRKSNEMIVPGVDGKNYVYLSSRFPIKDSEGKIYAVGGVANDVTLVKQSQVELKKTNKELETFTYIASHDLRSPLVNLKGFSVELKNSIEAIIPFFGELSKSLDDEHRRDLDLEINSKIPRALDFISNSAEKMDRLTGAILKLSRLGRRELIFEKIKTENLVRTCIKALSHEIDKKRCHIKVEKLPIIEGDKTSIEQIFGNLLDNALKFLSPSRRGLISVGAEEDKNSYIFFVKDNGRGIVQEDFHKVFEIFRRAGDVDEIQGEGMGMPYVQTLVRRHGGNIWFSSEPDHGTTFYFSVMKDLKKQGSVT